MTVQITVRIPDDLVTFIDAEVAAGRCRSRADAVASAVRREQHQRAVNAFLEWERAQNDPTFMAAADAATVAGLPPGATW